jgi:hypothetical protein
VHPIDADAYRLVQPQSCAYQRLGCGAALQETPVFLGCAEIPVPAPGELLQTKGVKKSRHFVVTHSHRHGVTTGLVIGEKGQKEPTPAEAITLLKLDYEPAREEFVEVTEVAPVLLAKSRRHRKMTGGQRARLIAQWARRLYDITASWQGPIGMQLAYLFAAMARGSHVALKRHSALVRLLRQEAVPASDPIWKYIQIEE